MALRSWIAFGLVAGATLLHAQAGPTASRAGDLQIGVGYGIAKSDYSPSLYKGIAPYITFDFNNHLGIEANFRFLQDPGSLNLYEKTYEIGGRYHVTYGRLLPYGKLMYGRGVFNFQNNVANLAYNMYAVGGGADYRLLPYINIRGDFEYQSWSGFPPHGLNPIVGTIGVAYHFR